MNVDISQRLMFIHGRQFSTTSGAAPIVRVADIGVTVKNRGASTVVKGDAGAQGPQGIQGKPGRPRSFSCRYPTGATVNNYSSPGSYVGCLPGEYLTGGACTVPSGSQTIGLEGTITTVSGGVVHACVLAGSSSTSAKVRAEGVCCKMYCFTPRPLARVSAPSGGPTDLRVMLRSRSSGAMASIVPARRLHGPANGP